LDILRGLKNSKKNEDNDENKDVNPLDKSRKEIIKKNKENEEVIFSINLIFPYFLN
jgi:hypothetical protein